MRKKDTDSAMKEQWCYGLEATDSPIVSKDGVCQV